MGKKSGDLNRSDRDNDRAAEDDSGLSYTDTIIAEGLARTQETAAVGTASDAATAVTTGAATDEEATDPEQIRAEIEQTRSGMSQTIDAIQEKLNPDTIKEQVKEHVNEAVQSAKDTVREATLGRAEKMMESAGDKISEVSQPVVAAVSNVMDSMTGAAGAAGNTVRQAGSAVRTGGSSLVDTIRENPIPAAMIGLGIGWLIMKNTHAPAIDNTVSRVQNRVGSTVGQAQDTVTDWAGQAQDTVTDWAGQAQDTVGGLAHQTHEQVSQVKDQVKQGVQQGAQRAGSGFQQALQDSPLAVGAVALALGTAVGLSVPATSVENNLLGDAHDNLMQKAQTVAQDTVQKVQSVAQEAGRAASQAAREEAANQGLTG